MAFGSSFVSVPCFSPSISRSFFPAACRTRVRNQYRMSSSASPSQMQEEELNLCSADGTGIGAFYVRQARSTGQKAVLLLTDILGYKNEDTRDVARRIAEIGFPTIVPDLFREKPWAQGRDKSEYEQWRAQHDTVTVRNDFLSAHDYLKEHNVEYLAMMGFCFGGGRLMEEIAKAEQGLNPKVSIAFYPTRFDPVDVGKSAICSLLFITGDEDPLVPMDIVATLRETMKSNEKMKDLEIQIVEKAGHAFAHHPKTEQDQIHSELSFARAEEYLRIHL